jgi:hypothetical protein
MKNKQKLLLLAAGLCATISVQAVGPQVTAEFAIKDPKTHKLTPASEARLDQTICLSIRSNLTPEGEHSYQLIIYDGAGKEAHLARTTITAERQRWAYQSCIAFDEDRVAPGTWWYVGELDGEPLFSESIEMRPASQ